MPVLVFQYEPVIQPGSHQYLHHMTLYECRGDQTALESAAETTGSVCYDDSDKPAFQCNTIAATWSLGSEVRRKLHLCSHTKTSMRFSNVATSASFREFVTRCQNPQNKDTQKKMITFRIYLFIIIFLYIYLLRFLCAAIVIC